ncbi:hypothetical protein MVEN_02294000 [Mycena venus]|uniref:Uncharacterized protein n=1 Tax=Mycena venus TaxID=2733690 RepID=A0A8H6X5Z6_9AGAR|nr:hypothetical protein MVEN_02294000 [Mycena venus]
MSLSSLSSAAGPSSTTLQALSEYCASSDSPESPSRTATPATPSFLNLRCPLSPKLQRRFFQSSPAIIVQSDRFQSAGVQEKMLKALRFSAGSGFTRPASPSSSRSRRDRAVSTQAIYEGLPPSPSDCFFNDTSLLDNSTPKHIGLGILVPSSSTSTSDLRLLSPLASRSASPTPGAVSPADRLSSRLLLSPTPPSSNSPITTPSSSSPSPTPPVKRQSPVLALCPPRARSPQ